MRQSQSCLDGDVELELDLDFFELEMELEVEREVEVPVEVDSLLELDVFVELDGDSGFDFSAVEFSACPGRATTPIKTTRATLLERILLFE